MSNTAITVENLGKMYRISHQGRGYQTLRERILSIPSIIRGSSVKREEFWALRDVSFEINAGDRVGIIGRNGAGKSTLLKILSRIIKPTHGRAVIRGRVASLLEVGTGFHPELTGRENIFMNGALLGMSRAEIRGKFDEIVDFAEVEKFIDTPVKRYSSGMYVRLAFAVAAHLEPEILLVDEVLAVGDIQFQEKCIGKMEDVAKNQGRTVLFVSHNMTSIMRLCLKAFLLEKGKIALNGNCSTVVDYYLDKSVEIKSCIEWGKEDNAPGNIELIRYHKLGVLDKNKRASMNNMYIEDQFYIETEYVIKKPLKGAWLGIQISTINSEVLFCCGDVNFQEEHVRLRESGIYRTLFEIPAGLLNQSQYFVGLLSHIPGVMILVNQPCILKIDMKQKCEIAGSGIQPGLIRPDIKCTTMKVGES